MLNISVVIITRNRCKDLKECLNSIFDMNVTPNEVIVVDNLSTDGTEKIKEFYPIKFISIKERGMTKARNMGISVAQGDVVAFVDDDVIVDKNWLKYLIEAHEKDGIYGVGGRVIPYGMPKNCYVKVGGMVGKVFDDGLILSNFDIFMSHLIEVDFLYGCNMSFKKEALVKVGGFDENLRGNCFREDTDACLRMKKLGYKLIYEPRALVWHKYKGKIIDHKSIYWYTRNNTYVYMKNVFPENKAKLPLFLYRMFFPPKDWVERVGFRIKLSPKAFLRALIGLIDGIKAYHDLKR